MSNNDNTGKKIGKSFLSMFKRLFVRDKIELNVLEEEALQTPMKAVFKRLIVNKIAIIGFCMFVIILLFSFVGSLVFPLNEVHTELTHFNIRPSRNFLNYPSELNDSNIINIVSGVSFSAALTDDGNVHMWGTEPNLELPGVSDFILNVPQEVQDAFIVQIEAGMRFIIALDDEGNLHGWGHAGHGQTTLPDTISGPVLMVGGGISRIVAGSMWSAVILGNGNMHVWGSFQAEQNFMVPFEAMGRIVDAFAVDVNMILLLDDGSIMPMGVRGTEFYTNVPPELMDGSTRVEQVAVTNRNVMALDEHGTAHIWGSMIDGLHRFPEGMTPENVVHISAGYRNFIAVKENGDVYVWGADDYGQNNLPRGIENAGVHAVFANAFQFYAVDEDNNIVSTWGNRGYLFGSDHFGRDIFTRLVHGGRISLSVGIIAVVISTVIAIIIGLASGFFGGWVDHTLMRVADIVDALPFLPLVVILSFAIGDTLDQAQRMYFVMIILGLLSWQGLARFIRAQLLIEREKDFVLAARALGIKQRSIMFKHILPNVFNFVIVQVTLSYATFILMESALSFLGFGITEPVPTWGNMLTSAQETMVIQYFWWRWIIPGLFLIAACLSINMIGDALREAMDPKSQER
ncbi:MAG: ABC transporter permease subunit [Oscillospiraceae bacterium]|nr:ABC transporter permease subunit [Oscillospiraceae bacterium]